MAGEPPHPGRRRNQDRAVRANLASFCRTPDRFDSTGVLGPHALLDGCGPGDETRRLSALLQPLSRPQRAGWAAAGIDDGPGRPSSAHRFVPLASTLPRTLRDADRGVRAGPISSRMKLRGPLTIWNSPWTGGDSSLPVRGLTAGA